MQGSREDDALVDTAVAIRPDNLDDGYSPTLQRSEPVSPMAAQAGPFRFGRFTVLGALGGGGMGTVFVAYDPDLDRKIALKVLHVRGDRGRKDVLREGRALARLKHPNVVAVYEVGVVSDRVFVAMEYVAGESLREWLKAPRRAEEVLARLVEAGRGLAAAHSVELVHRDIKPENLVIDGEGHTRVIDFGLARPLEEVLRTRSSDGSASPQATSSAHAGTPAYMAPERLAGDPGDARADQYAFCVTCWEALFGARPPGEAPGRRVPAWLRQALARGLAADPSRRWPTMAPLLAALERGRTRARVRTGAALLTGVALVIGAAEGARRWDVDRRVDACAATGAAIDEVWNDESRQRLRDAFVATGVAGALTMADKVMPWLDAQAAAWRRVRTDACMNTEVRGVWTADLADRAAWCLEDRQMELASLVTEFEHADAKTMRKAVAAATSLDPIEDCVDEDLLGRQPAPPPADAREALRGVRAELSKAQALGFAGKFKEALAVVAAVREAPEVQGWPPLWAAARMQEGYLLEKTGAYADGEAASREAYFAAARAGAWDAAVGAAMNMVTVVGDRLARHAEGRQWARHAELAIAYAGDRLGLREAYRLGDLANIEYRAGDYAAARALHERALAKIEAALGPEHPAVAARLDNLAMVRHAAGDDAEALPLHARALAIFEASLGPDHPAVAAAMINLANVHAAQGSYAEATALFERALAIFEATQGANHPNVAASLTNLGNLHYDMGAHAAARPLYARALAIDEATVGTDHPNYAMSLVNVASVHRAVGEYAEARALQERALGILEAKLGPDSSDVATVLGNLANIHRATRAFPEARELQARALAIFERSLGPDHPNVATSLDSLAGIDLDAGEPKAALPRLERAMAIYDAHAGVQPGESTTCFDLARTLVDTGGDKARAIGLATRARDGFRAAGAGRAEQLADVEAWLAAQAG